MRLSSLFTKSSSVAALALASSFIPQFAFAADNKCTIAFENIPKGHIVVDVETGTILSSSGDIDRSFHPASLTKIVSTHVILDAFDQGLLNPNQQIIIQGSNAGDADRAMIGRRMTIEQGLNMGSASPNAYYETVAGLYPGGRSAFIRQMNVVAGMAGALNTNFVNVNGLNFWGSYGCANHRVSPRDYMAIFDHAYHKHPDQFHRVFGGTDINTNGIANNALHPTSALLIRQNDIRAQYNIEIDEVKTGYIRFSGAHLFASARVNGRRVYVIEYGASKGNCAIDKSFRIRDCNVLNHLLAIDGRSMSGEIPSYGDDSNPPYTASITSSGSVRMSWGNAGQVTLASASPVQPNIIRETLTPTTQVRLPRRIDDKTIQLWNGTVIPYQSEPITGRPSSIPLEPVREQTATSPSLNAPIPVS